MRFPVYLIVTKCDLINGFIDYFDDLSADERQQVWGVTLPFSENYDSEGVTGRLSRELDALFARLGERLLYPWRAFGAGDQAAAGIAARGRRRDRHDSDLR